jgi:hypothetical protein
MSEKFSPSQSFPVQAVLFEASLVLLAVVLGWILGQSPLTTLRFNPHALQIGSLAVLPLLCLLLVCERVPWRPVQEVRRVMDDLIAPMFKSWSWFELAGLSLLAGLGEEMLFRGVFQAALVQWTGDFLPHSPAGAMLGDWTAVLAVAILFGLLHALNLAYAVLATLMGLYLGWLWMASENLVVPVVAHALYDFLALLYILRQHRGET